VVSLAFGLRLSTERMGLPGSWVIFFERAVHHDPAGCTAILCHRVMDDAVAASYVDTVGTRDQHVFEAYF
jgi:hypothetical protein